MSTITRSPGPPRGLLHLTAHRDKFRHARHLPDPGLATVVEHYWFVRWDLRGQPPHRQESLTHPSLHLVFERQDLAHHARLVGVVRKRFSRVLEGEGRVFGVKFKPGGFHPFVQTPVSAFTDRQLPAATIFGPDVSALDASLLPHEDDDDMVMRLIDRFLRDRRVHGAPVDLADPQVATVSAIVARIAADREITKVGELARRAGLNTRQLQRLFNQYVGASPKWVIQRYRLHDALERVASGAVVDWSALAADLGYFDQAHFIKDFKALVGQSPTDYARGPSAAPHVDPRESE